MQRQLPWQHSSPAVSRFHSPPPFALLADKVHRQPPTPSSWDASLSDEGRGHVHILHFLYGFCCCPPLPPPVFLIQLSALQGRSSSLRCSNPHRTPDKTGGRVHQRSRGAQARRERWETPAELSRARLHRGGGGHWRGQGKRTGRDVREGGGSYSHKLTAAG